MVDNKLILDQAPLPIALLDLDYHILGLSKKWRDTYNLSENYKDKPFFKLMPNLPNELKIDLDYCREGLGEREDEVKCYLSSGKLVWYKWQISQYFDNDKPSGFIVFLTDTTKENLDKQLFAKSQQVARIGGWEVDLINNQLYWCNITKKIHEVPEDFVPNLEKGINFYKEGYSRNLITEKVTQGIEKGLPWDVELQIITQSGKELWVRAKGEPELVDNKCVRICGTFQDIDFRKKTELKYKKTRDRLQMATAKAGFGIWEIDLITSEVVWDDNMYKIYGLKKKIVDNDLRTFFSEIVYPEDYAELKKLIDKATPENDQFTFIFRTKQDAVGLRYIKGMHTVILGEDNKPCKVIGIAEDVTEFVKTQKQLVSVEGALDALFENSAIGMALVDGEAKILKANLPLAKSLGYKVDELLGINFRSISHPEDLERDIPNFISLRRGEISNYKTEKRYFHKNGSVVHVIMNATVRLDLGDNLSYLIVQLVDITKLKNTENKLKGLLEISNKQNESLLNFAHIVSHNLRSHASNLTMISSLLIDNEVEEDEKEQTLDMLNEASEGLNETIFHLNEVVQVKLNTHNKMGRINLLDLIEKVVKNYEMELEKNEIKLAVNCCNRIEVLGLANYVESILTNLLSNAIKYKSPQRRPMINIAVRETEDSIVLDVADNGLGIDLKRHANKVFGMYKTFHNHPEAKGVGLFIIKNQIESMGGRISVTSNLDVGSTFTVHFNK